MNTEEYEFGELFIYDRYIIGEMNEGVCITTDIVKEIFKSADTNFANEKWVYISNRITSYSIEPLVYTKLQEINPNIIGMAVVSVDNLHAKMFDLEKSFIRGDYKFKKFSEIGKAILWGCSLIRRCSS